MAYLLTSGHSIVSRGIAGLMEEADFPFLVGHPRKEEVGRSNPYAVHLDLLEQSTWKPVLGHKFDNQKKIRTVYLVPPNSPDPVPPVMKFIDVAVTRFRIRKIVLLADGTTEKDGTQLGVVWRHLDTIGIAYSVIRASWFMGMFWHSQDQVVRRSLTSVDEVEFFARRHHLQTIQEEDRFYSAAGDGKISPISSEDVAAVAFEALTNRSITRGDFETVGPELLSHDQIATKLSDCLGRKIEHVKLPPDETSDRRQQAGINPLLAKALTMFELRVSRGPEKKLTVDVERVLGRPPQKFDEWLNSVRDVFVEVRPGTVAEGASPKKTQDVAVMIKSDKN